MTTSSWYRSTYWNMKGNKEYCRAGYEAASARFSPEDADIDCTGRHIMITGANKGLGEQTAHELAKRGAVLHLVCRNMDDAKAVRATIVSETGNDKIHLYQLDLSRPREIVQFCAEFCSSHDELHVLVNNAGVMRHERVLDDDGLEYNFAVNTLAVHLMVVGLMPLLEKCEDSRVVTVSSAGMLTVKLDPVDLTFENMDPFNGRLAYSQTKRQQVVLTLCYAQYFSKVHFSSMHPGWADTLAVRTSLPQFYEMYKDRLRSPAQGADTIVWLAASPRVTSHNSGLFFQDREPVSPHLPLAWTRTSIAEEKLLLEKLQQITEQVSQPRPEQTIDSQRSDETTPDQNGSVVSCPTGNEDAIECVNEATNLSTSEVPSQEIGVTSQTELETSNGEIRVEDSLEIKPESEVNLLDTDTKDTSLTSSTTTDQSATDSGVGVTPEPITDQDEVNSPLPAEDDVVAKSSEQDSSLSTLTTNLEAAKIEDSVKESTVS